MLWNGWPRHFWAGVPPDRTGVQQDMRIMLLKRAHETCADSVEPARKTC
jgi:hypothetical protein